MRCYAVIGSPVAHSRSPEIYRPLFEKHGIDADFIRILVEPHELPYIRSIAQPLSGFAVTMPHKRAIIPYLDGLSAEAEACGAVNIVERRGGLLIGHNTDGGGLVDALRAIGADPDGKTAAILGRGGAALAAAHALSEAGCSPTLFVREKRGESPFPEMTLGGLCGRYDLFINASPLGMEGGESFADLGFLRSMRPAAVLDMVYLAGGRTALTAEAERLGIPAADGSLMLRKQAERAFLIWTGLKA
ncbi:MAG: shikimate dehydrogenase [Clostridia bacterium]|nr:shikimate dehydrogenase [Clostridia bacterium]